LGSPPPHLHRDWAHRYCYFAGATLFAASVVGHFSKTMVLLLLPQFLNFAYSLPQLVKVVPCPRHRMPSLDPKTGDVRASYMELRPSDLSTAGKAVVWALGTLRLAHVLPADASGIVRVSNLTLINFALVKLGPCREDILCCRLLTFQAICAALTFLVRFPLASTVYDVVT
jgi:UDP-N-acetylglucosamine--dolichyl-phosphate N-acetylglucosaminephosphotransferase